MVDFIAYWTKRAELTAKQLFLWIGLAENKFHQWKARYGMPNQHNGDVPKEGWLTPAEREAVVAFAQAHPGEGYQRLTYMMMDQDIVAASPATVHRILQKAGLTQRWHKPQTSAKGQGFKQPPRPHRDWHTDVTYLNLGGTFYYVCSVLDGYSRAILAWDIREKATSADVQQVVEQARELYPEAQNATLISDNGPQFIARDFKHYLRQIGMGHIRISPGYPQSNGKQERWHATLKQECFRPKTPLTLAEAKRNMATYVEHYNRERLHSALGYIAPLDFMAGKQHAIWSDRDRKLEEARRKRRNTSLLSLSSSGNAFDLEQP